MHGFLSRAFSSAQGPLAGGPSVAFRHRVVEMSLGLGQGRVRTRTTITITTDGKLLMEIRLVLGALGNQLGHGCEIEGLLDSSIRDTREDFIVDD